MDAVDGVEALGEDEARVLQVALEPPPVPLGEVDDRVRECLAPKVEDILDEGMVDADDLPIMLDT